MLARDRLIKSHLRFVITVASGYTQRLSLGDAIAEGCVGLLTAIDKFDVSRGCKFISYAVWWIRQALMAAAHQQHTVRRPDNQVSLLHRYRKLAAALEEELSRTVTPPEVVEEMGITQIQGDGVVGLLKPVVRLDGPAYKDHDRSTESMGARHLADPLDVEARDDELDEKSIAQTMDRHLNALLTPRERKIVRLYYGSADQEPMTLEQVGQVFGITRERVRQVRDIALAKLREEPALGRLMKEHVTGTDTP